MPSPLTHLIVSVPINALIMKQENKKKIIFFSFFAAIAADFDYVGYLFNFGNLSFFGHRGFTHSIFFAIVIATLICIVFFRNVDFKSKAFLFLLFNFFLAALSHPLLDYLINQNNGVALFFPFSTERFSFPFAPINEEICSAFEYYRKYFWLVLKVEIIYLIFPAILFYYLIKRKIKNS